MKTHIKRRWRRQRPDTAGLWLWKEDGSHALHKYSTLLLASGGTEVASMDDAEEGTDQYYFEMTETTQKEMPGLWMKAPEVSLPSA